MAHFILQNNNITNNLSLAQMEVIKEELKKEKEELNKKLLVSDISYIYFFVELGYLTCECSQRYNNLT